jgi:hypothetical protein
MGDGRIAGSAAGNATRRRTAKSVALCMYVYVFINFQRVVGIAHPLRPTIRRSPVKIPLPAGYQKKNARAN